MADILQNDSRFRPLSPLPDHWFSLGNAFLHQAKTQPDAPAIQDSTGMSFTYHKLLVSSLALANILSERLDPCPYVGILLPPTAAAVLANIALTLIGKIPVNLNYTMDEEHFNSCISQCGITTILTSEKVIQHLKFKSSQPFLQIETLRDKATLTIKAWSWTEAGLIPETLLSQFLPGIAANHCHNRLDETAVVLFTAGSTGTPKGVMLTHGNILSDIHAIQEHLHDSEKVLGIAPFFHSFGFTMTLWAVLSLGQQAVYHYDPFDARRVGNLCEKSGATVLFCTPTIMRAYLHRCKADQFKTIRLCILGGEKLKPQLESDIKSTFSLTPLQGYGLTETGPVISTNVPDEITFPDGLRVSGIKSGTVGIPLSGTRVRIIDIATGQQNSPGNEGMIQVQGPQVMQGYLNNPEATAEVLKDGWFITGDLGYLDDEGFLTITGRLSQFSKIGGEMVPHLGVEQEILKAIRKNGSAEHPLSVTCIPDEKRGERLAVVYADSELSPTDIVKKLKQSTISKLWIPAAEDFIYVDALPTLSNGKLDLQKIKALAFNKGDPETETKK
jgi:acyl-[acyl-carrier-protein]-phospholipid O-acyltransferase / long-chain-fatty-acid--[acyl-carrier-protein] ligase